MTCAGADLGPWEFCLKDFWEVWGSSFYQISRVCDVFGDFVPVQGWGLTLGSEGLWMDLMVKMLTSGPFSASVALAISCAFVRFRARQMSSNKTRFLWARTG